MSDVSALITAIATLVLVLVTGYYAYLTQKLAASAKESAHYSKEAAEAAKGAAAASVASVDVDFTLSPQYALEPTPEREEYLWGVRLICTGATVFVHTLELQMIAWPLGPHEAIQHLNVNDLLTDWELPARIHRNEEIVFELEGGAREEEAGRSISELEGMVTYSLDGVSEPIERQVRWRGAAGRDFEYLTVRQPQAERA